MFAKLYLEITNTCNLRCDFCPGTRRPRRFLSEAEFRLLAGRLRPHGRFLYLHVMGEPLLHPLLGRFLSIAGELDFRVVLTTNGTLLPDRQTELLAAPALHKVNISLHAQAGGAGPYLDGCAGFARRASAQGIVCCLRLWNLGAADSIPPEDAVPEALRAAFPGPWTPNTRGFRLADRLFLEWDRRFVWPDADGPALAERGFCRALRDQAAVLNDGTVVPCCLDREGRVPLGNLFESELSAILAGPRARALYEGFSARVLREPLCRTCGYARRFDRPGDHLSAKEMYP